MKDRVETYHTRETKGRVNDFEKEDAHIIQYIKIANSIRENPFISLSGMSSHINLSKSTISKYLKKMYRDRILTGPQVSLKPHSNYTPYIYLLQVSNPIYTFQELKILHHVKNLAIVMGEWNMSILTDRMMDFSALEGFQRVVFAGKRYDVYSPRIRYTTWEQSWKEIRDKLECCTPVSEKKNRGILPELPWGDQEWELYKAMRLNVRQDIHPVLHKHYIGYETFQRWKKTVLDRCTVHMGFFPGGFDSYMNFYILFQTDYTQAVRELFSLFPTTPFIADLDDQILVLVRIPFDLRDNLCSIIGDMREKGIVEDAHYAVGLFT